MTSYTPQEVVPRFFYRKAKLNPAVAQATVRSYFALQEAWRKRLRVSIERLHLALIRSSPGERMVELAIALETLVVGSDSGEHTFKVALRAALLSTSDPTDAP
jgi:hypothetical protein